jgi:peptidoglycan hydrolase-like protein with peptidoglycan-binding domain
MTWRIARAILALRAEIDALAPNRNKVSDGTIGDAAHATRVSDHNPYVKDARGLGVVRALDVTHDPSGGLDAGRLAEHVRILGANGDRRVRYVIWNRRIVSATSGWRWRAYLGSNPHTRHVHISVPESAGAYDFDAPWGWSKASAVTTWVRRDELPIRKGHKDGRKRLISKIQRPLGVTADGYFGRETEKRAKQWQSVHDEKGQRVPTGRGLVVDGIVGLKTWGALFPESQDLV